MTLLNIKLSNGTKRLVKYKAPNKGTVVIGGRTYPTVKIGNQWWLAENLVLETSIFYYPNNNSANKENYGLLYPYKILYDEVIPNLPTGLRLPHKSDFDNLKSMDSTPADWISPLNGGNGSLGLNLPFAGYRNYLGDYYDFNVIASVWTDTFRETTSEGVDRMYSLLVNSSTIDTSDYNAGSASQLVYTSAAVRLVKDA